MTYTTLIAPADLAPHLGQAGWVILDCRHQLQDHAYGKRAYLQGHVPGACFSNVDRDLSGPITALTGRHPMPDMAGFSNWLAGQGVSNGSQVVAYDDHNGVYASRLWWMLRYLGHPDVAVLDGGFARWTKEGRPVETQVPRPASGTFVGRLHPALQASLQEVAAISAQSGHGERTGAIPGAGTGAGQRRPVLFDARGAERFRGESEPIDPRPGHIPGAANLPFAGNVTPEGTLLPADQLRRRFQQALAGQDPAQTIHYCGSGVSACHNLLAMTVAGLKPGRLYVGSWSQWSKDPARAAATGPEPD